jgi:preprotein translocase subunit SecY
MLVALQRLIGAWVEPMTSEFVRRAGFTLGALLIYRLGCNIPLPGINFEMVEQLFRAQPAGSLRAMLQSSGSVRHLAIFALGITPYVSAAILLQLGGIIFSRMRRLQSQGERGRQTLRKLTLGLTIGLAAFQAYGVGVALEQINPAFVDPGALFLLSTVATLTGGAIFLAWLSEQMTAFGLGNGVALILLSGTVTALRDPILTITDLDERGLLSSNTLVSLIGLVVFATGAAVVFERARRRFPIDYSNRQIGDRTFAGLSSALTIKLNPAGIIPAILASWLIGIATLIAGLVAGPDLVTNYLLPERPVYLAVYAALIFLCALFYTAYVFDPEQAAERLQKQGGALRSVAPGEATVVNLDAAVSRLALLGATYLTAICLLPDILRFYLHVPLYLGGLPFLILICTALDFDHQIRGYLRFSGIARRP